MVSKGDNKFVLWSVYFDKNLSRSEGRKVPRNLAVENPSLDKIAKIAEEMGLNPVVERDARYPSRQWSNRGRVLIDMVGKKRKLLLDIASRLVKS